MPNNSDDYEDIFSKDENPPLNKPEQKSESGKNRFYSYDISNPGNNESERKAQGVPVPPPGDDSADFDIHFDFDREYRDVPENRPLRRRRERRSGCLAGLLYSVFIICLSLTIASLMWLAATDILGLDSEYEQVNINVHKNYTVDEIADILHDADLIKYKFLFKMYAAFSSAEEKITAGSFTLNKNYDYRALVNGMMARSKTRVETKVSIPEGYTLAQIFTLLESSAVCSADELWDAAANYDFDYDFLDSKTLGDRRRLEGFLFPNTYNFYVDSTPEQTITKFLNEFRRQFGDEYKDRAAELGYSVQEIIIIASMIEREAGADSERATVASVIYNRLNSPEFPHLEIDATIHYAIAGTDQSFSLELDSLYNTYKFSGLPIGPISNPGAESIKAALYPETTDYYYYALNKSGTHNFYKTFASHNSFVQSSEYGGR